MGSGFYKMLAQQESVETKYHSIYEIPLMTFERQEQKIQKSESKKVLFVTSASQSKLADFFLKQITQKSEDLEAKGIKVVALATNSFGHEKTTFEEQQQFLRGYGLKGYPSV